MSGDKSSSSHPEELNAADDGPVAQLTEGVGRLNVDEYDGYFESGYCFNAKSEEINKVWTDVTDRWCKKGCQMYFVSPFIDGTLIQKLLEIHQRKPTPSVKVYLKDGSGEWKNMNGRWQFIADTTWHPMWTDYLVDDDFMGIFQFSLKRTEKNEKKEKRKGYFHSKFWAGVLNDNVELVITSANLTKSHITEEKINFDTVCYKTLTKDEFETLFIKPMTDGLVFGSYERTKTTID